MNIQEEGISFNSAESKQLTEVEIQRRGEVETQLWRKGQQDCGPGVGKVGQGVWVTASFISQELRRVRVHTCQH